MRAAAMLVLVACATVPAPPPPLVASKGPARPARITDAVITGRVLLAGEPVPEFGLVQTTTWTSSFWTHPILTVPQPRGRFELHVSEGTWDLIIGGRGFARTVLIGKELPVGRVTDLGDILVRPGFTVTGQVTDAQAVPIADAEVTIRSRFASDPVEDSIAARMKGEFVTRTDKHGRYQIHGATVIDVQGRSLKIAARTGTGEASLPEGIPAGNLTRDITVLPAGWIEVTVAGLRHGVLFLQSVTTPRAVWGRTFDKGTFQIHDVPIGDYWIQAGGFQRKLVIVVAGQTTAVQFP